MSYRYSAAYRASSPGNPGRIRGQAPVLPLHGARAVIRRASHGSSDSLHVHQVPPRRVPGDSLPVSCMAARPPRSKPAVACARAAVERAAAPPSSMRGGAPQVPLVIQMTDDEKFLWKGDQDNTLEKSAPVPRRPRALRQAGRSAAPHLAGTECRMARAGSTGWGKRMQRTSSRVGACHRPSCLHVGSQGVDGRSALRLAPLMACARAVSTSTRHSYFRTSSTWATCIQQWYASRRQSPARRHAVASVSPTRTTLGNTRSPLSRRVTPQTGPPAAHIFAPTQPGSADALLYVF